MVRRVFAAGVATMAAGAGLAAVALQPRGVEAAPAGTQTVTATAVVPLTGPASVQVCVNGTCQATPQLRSATLSASVSVNPGAVTPPTVTPDPSACPAGSAGTGLVVTIPALSSGVVDATISGTLPTGDRVGPLSAGSVPLPLSATRRTILVTACTF